MLEEVTLNSLLTIKRLCLRFKRKGNKAQQRWSQQGSIKLSRKSQGKNVARSHKRKLQRQSHSGLKSHVGWTPDYRLSRTSQGRSFEKHSPECSLKHLRFTTLEGHLKQKKEAELRPLYQIHEWCNGNSSGNKGFTSNFSTTFQSKFTTHSSLSNVYYKCKNIASPVKSTKYTS